MQPRARTFVVLLIFALVFPVWSDASSPYFSLSTDRTFQPGEKITVHLYTRDVQALEFRLYRVNDPVLFFEQLRNVHGFGTGHYGPKEQIEEKTPIEKFHDWKRELWISIRNFFRGQFSDRSRAEIREGEGQQRKSHLGAATMFAQVPLINSKQLVARWKQEVPNRFFSERQDVPVESLEKGAYVVEATDGNLRAYTILVVSELALVTKSAPGQLLAYSVDRRAGNPIAGTAVEVWAAHKKLASVETDKDGLGLLNLSTANAQETQDIRILGKHGRDVALVAPYYMSISSDPSQDWTGYVYTDRPVYRPGHPVHFKAILRTRAGEKYRVPAGESVNMAVQDPTGKQVFQSSGTISQFGSNSTLPAQKRPRRPVVGGV